MIARNAYLGDFDALLNLKQNAQSLQKSLDDDKNRDLEAELKELTQLKILFRERYNKVAEAARAEYQAKQNASND